MDKDNGVKIAWGSGGAAGWRKSKGEKLDDCDSITNKIYF